MPVLREPTTGGPWLWAFAPEGRSRNLGNLVYPLHRKVSTLEKLWGQFQEVHRLLKAHLYPQTLRIPASLHLMLYFRIKRNEHWKLKYNSVNKSTFLHSLPGEKEAEWTEDKPDWCVTVVSAMLELEGSVCSYSCWHIGIYTYIAKQIVHCLLVRLKNTWDQVI